MQEQRAQTNLLSCPCLSIKGVILQSYWRASRQFSSPQCETNIRRHISKRGGVSQNDEKISLNFFVSCFGQIVFSALLQKFLFFSVNGGKMELNLSRYSTLSTTTTKTTTTSTTTTSCCPHWKIRKPNFFSWWQLSSPFLKWQELCLWCGNELFCWAGMLFGFSSSLSFKLV